MLSIFLDFQASSMSTAFYSSVAIVLSIGVYVLLVSSQPRFPSKAPKPVQEGYPILGTLRFFTARWDFFRHARAQSSSGNFSFLIGKYQVVGLTGDTGRQVFFESRDLGFQEGYDPRAAHNKLRTQLTVWGKLCCSLWTVTK
jgi:hypothetical protein